MKILDYVNNNINNAGWEVRNNKSVERIELVKTVNMPYKDYKNLDGSVEFEKGEYHEETRSIDIKLIIPSGVYGSADEKIERCEARYEKIKERYQGDDKKIAKIILKNVLIGTTSKWEMFDKYCDDKTYILNQKNID